MKTWKAKAMNNYSLKLMWSDEDEGFIATCPEFPGLSAFGETREEAMAEAVVAVEGFIQMYEGEGSQLPTPERVERYSGQFRVRLPKTLHRQIVELAKTNKTSLNQLVVAAIAERVGASRFCDEMVKEVRQLLAEVNAWKQADQSPRRSSKQSPRTRS